MIDYARLTWWKIGLYGVVAAGLCWLLLKGLFCFVGYLAGA